MEEYFSCFTSSNPLKCIKLSFSDKGSSIAFHENDLLNAKINGLFELSNSKRYKENNFSMKFMNGDSFLYIELNSTDDPCTG